MSYEQGQGQGQGYGQGQGQKSSITSDVYEGSAQLGRFSAGVTLFCGIFFGLCLSGCGSYLIFNNDDDKYFKVDGIVKSSECSTNTTYGRRGRRSTKHDCDMIVEYTIEGVEYSEPLFTNSSTRYSEGRSISLSVAKNDHTEIKIATLPSEVMGSIFLLMGFFLICCVGLNYYMTTKSKTYAQFYLASRIL